jgi:hypothetical protein
MHATIVTIDDALQQSCEDHFPMFLNEYCKGRCTVEFESIVPTKDPLALAQAVRRIMKKICRTNESASFGIILHNHTPR